MPQRFPKSRFPLCFLLSFYNIFPIPKFLSCEKFLGFFIIFSLILLDKLCFYINIPINLNGTSLTPLYKFDSVSSFLSALICISLPDFAVNFLALVISIVSPPVTLTCFFPPLLPGLLYP